MGEVRKNSLIKQLQKEQKQVEDQLKADTKKLQEAKEGQLAKKAGAVSTVSTAKSTTESTLSKLRNLPNKLSRDKGLNNFLSGKNEELKKVFLNLKRNTFAITCLMKL